MIIVDSSVWIDALQGRETAEVAWIRENIQSKQLALTDLILFEVLSGTRADASFLAFQEDLLRFVIFATCGKELALNAATQYRILRKRGITIRGSVDCITAAFCIREGYALLHNDRDFDPFEKLLGLKVIHP